MRKIKLSQNKVALVDDHIYKLVEDVPFHAVSSKGRFYARTSRTLLKDKPRTFLHWLVIAPPCNRSFQIHFKDGNTLNCQLQNLEYVLRSQNTQSHSKKQNLRIKSSKYLGVSKSVDRKRKKIWTCLIKHEKKVHRLGRFITEEEAAIAYNKKAIELFGLSAKLNKVAIV